MAKKKAKTDQLTILQESFVRILFKNPSLTQQQAYIQAGYKSRGATADVACSRLLKNVKIQTALQKLKDGASKRAEISVAKTVKEYALVGFSDIADFMDDKHKIKKLSDMDPDKRRTIESIKVTKVGRKQSVEIKLCNKLHALDAIMKNLGGFEKDNDQKSSKPVMIVNFAEIDVNG